MTVSAAGEPPPPVNVIIRPTTAPITSPRRSTSVPDPDARRRRIIVVDDGSTDNTREVADGYGPRVTYLTTDHSGDWPTRRNVGVRHASARTLAFLDSDDLLSYTVMLFELESRFLDAFPEIGTCYAEMSAFSMMRRSSNRYHLKTYHHFRLSRPRSRTDRISREEHQTRDIDVLPDVLSPGGSHGRRSPRVLRERLETTSEPDSSRTNILIPRSR